MATFPSIQNLAASDGVKYAVSVPLTTPIAGTDVDIYNTVIQHPILVNYLEAFEAIVTFVAQNINSNTAWVIMQTDLGDGNWIDVCGCRWTGTSGQAVFTLSAGVAGAAVVQQTRAAGVDPGANFSNQITLGGRIRFVGAAKIGTGSSSSSSSSGSQAIAQVLATVLYRALGVR